jgi:magnesium transporter
MATSPEPEAGGTRAASGIPASGAPASSSASPASPIPSQKSAAPAATTTPAAPPKSAGARASRKPRMTRKRLMRRPAPGTAPGTLMVDPNSPTPVIDVIAYGPDDVIEQHSVSVEQLEKLLGQRPVTWVNVSGLGDEAILRRLGELFHLHLLALEDVVNVHQRSKFDLYPEQVFIVARMIEIDNDGLSTDQLSLFLGERLLVTFQERPGDCFDLVRQRIRAGRGRLRTAGTSYLAYSLLDAVVDSYFPILESFGERLEHLEDEIIAHPTERVIHHIHDVKRDLLVLRRSIWPLREMLHALVREPVRFVATEDRFYFQDCYDHSIQVMDLVETFRELGSDLMDVYLSSVSNRLNEVMKLLTIFTTIFIPLTFIAGVYGMNFDPDTSPWNMPELRWYWGYPLSLLLMAVVAVGMLIYFRRRGWLGDLRRHEPARLHELERPGPPTPPGPPAPPAR